MLTLKERLGLKPDPPKIERMENLPLKDRIAALKKQIPAASIPSSTEEIEEDHNFDNLNLTDRYGAPITLNKKQAEAVNMVIAGENFVISGEAGTGKTTTLQAVGKALWLHHQDLLHPVEYRANDGSGSRVIGTSVAYVSFTRKAVANMARALCQDPVIEEAFSASIMTIHNLLEYAPVFEWSAKHEKEIRIFRPMRTSLNPLDITHLFIDEASMVGLDLWGQLWDALPENVQIIFMGDINQLPPVFGQSVMSYALQKLPIVYLDHVYRQALDNEIIADAHAVLQGKPISATGRNVHWIKGKKGQATPTADRMAKAMKSWLTQAIDNHRNNADTPYKFNPDEDIILVPWNKADKPMTTHNMNYLVAQKLGEERNADVWHIIAGFHQWFLAIGDRVFCNKLEGTIVNITRNMGYIGKRPVDPSPNMNRWGFIKSLTPNGASNETSVDDIEDEYDFDNLDIDLVTLSDDDGKETSRAASHIVTVQLETGEQITLSTAGDFNPQFFSLGYALSVHKSQGSEWPRIILMFHKVHMPMMSRELLYTAMTRAREELIILSREDVIRKAIGSPRIKGNTLKEKIEYFNSGYLDKEVPLTK